MVGEDNATSASADGGRLPGPTFPHATMVAPKPRNLE